MLDAEGLQLTSWPLATPAVGGCSRRAEGPEPPVDLLYVVARDQPHGNEQSSTLVVNSDRLDRPASCQEGRDRGHHNAATTALSASTGLKKPRFSERTHPLVLQGHFQGVRLPVDDEQRGFDLT